MHLCSWSRQIANGISLKSDNRDRNSVRSGSGLGLWTQHCTGEETWVGNRKVLGELERPAEVPLLFSAGSKVASALMAHNLVTN